MKYRVETTEKGYVETLEVDGKEYKKTWIYNGCGHYSCQDYEFYEQMENDGVTCEDVLDKVYNCFDSLSLGTDLNDMQRWF